MIGWRELLCVFMYFNMLYHYYIEKDLVEKSGGGGGVRRTFYRVEQVRGVVRCVIRITRYI